ncbi:hypothetical protein MJ579_04650 [Klebsiella pneumoniae]|nr:hypothetical protein MJ579_04650 [Klebsiella pneumoniae]
MIIEIADQGCGIDEALHDRSFERGVTSSTSKDHGIGLWLVRSCCGTSRRQYRRRK